MRMVASRYYESGPEASRGGRAPRSGAWEIRPRRRNGEPGRGRFQPSHWRTSTVDSCWNLHRQTIPMAALQAVHDLAWRRGRGAASPRRRPGRRAGRWRCSTRRTDRRLSPCLRHRRAHRSCGVRVLRPLPVRHTSALSGPRSARRSASLEVLGNRHPDRRPRGGVRNGPRIATYRAQSGVGTEPATAGDRHGGRRRSISLPIDLVRWGLPE